MRQWKTALAALVMLAAACGGDPAPTDTTAPEEAVVIERPAVKTEAPPTTASREEPPTASEDETVTVPSEPETTTTTPTEECPEGFAPIEGGGCLHVPEDTPEDGKPATQDASTQRECEASGGVWDADASTCARTGVEAADGEPVRVVAEFWRHGLDEEALSLIDPESVGADRWSKRGEGSGFREKVFYSFYWFNDPYGDVETEIELLGDALNIARSKLEPPNTIYHPVRYDLRWAEHPTEVVITGYYPVGEIRTLTVFFEDPLWRADTIVYTPGDSTDAGEGVAIPAGPPIKPTTPFAEPRWPDTAEALGRDCPPVEQLWTANGAPVKDQCTLDAIDTALRYAWTSPSELRQRAIRDGHVLTDLFVRFDNQDEINPFVGTWLDEEGRSRITVNVQNMHWAGYWPGASMIYLEYQLVWANREMTEEERQGGIRLYTLGVEQGYDIEPERLLGEFDLSNTRFWESALMVRAADGTWRVSYRSFCRYAQIQITFEQPRFLCPDDPTPHFPDSDIYDEDIHSPKHPNYYNDPRARAPETPVHDGGAPRQNTEYVGVPPS
ncbi:MAG: hypothetical protein OXM62_05995 [bacterium]|nr:hypothetical protein [bacterium]